MIAPQILILSSILSLIWGALLIHAAQGYRRSLATRISERRRTDLVAAFRWLIAVLCVFIICFAYVFRTGMVLAGFGEAFIGQVVFFALLAPLLIGGLFCLVSLRYD